MVHQVWVLPFFVLALAANSSTALEPPPDLRSLVGESLEFRARWGLIPAATASLEVLDAGQDRVKFLARARTLPYIDAIYPVRDWVESTFLLPGLRSLRYHTRSKQGWGRSHETEVVFDPHSGKASYFRDGVPLRSLRVPDDVQDPLSCFFAYRVLDLPGDEDARLEITDGKKVITGVVCVLGRERVETPAGTFDTVLIEPKIEGISGIFKRSPGARILIWLTDDRWRRPVKMKSKVSVGHFTAELAEIRHPAADHPSL